MEGSVWVSQNQGLAYNVTIAILHDLRAHTKHTYRTDLQSRPGCHPLTRQSPCLGLPLHPMPQKVNIRKVKCESNRVGYTLIKLHEPELISKHFGFHVYLYLYPSNQISTYFNGFNILQVCLRHVGCLCAAKLTVICVVF